MRESSITPPRTKNLATKPRELSPLAAKHYEQGYNAGIMGLTPASTWNADQAAGYAAARRGATPHYSNVAGLPALARIA